MIHSLLEYTLVVRVSVHRLSAIVSTSIEIYQWNIATVYWSHQAWQNSASNSRQHPSLPHWPEYFSTFLTPFSSPPSLLSHCHMSDATIPILSQKAPERSGFQCVPLYARHVSVQKLRTSKGTISFRAAKDLSWVQICSKVHSPAAFAFALRFNQPSELALVSMLVSSSNLIQQGRTTSWLA